MAKLMKIITSVENDIQAIYLWCEASNREQLDNNGYDDFHADLYIDGKFIADIRPSLKEAKVFETMVDEIDWQEMLADELAEAGCNL